MHNKIPTEKYIREKISAVKGYWSNFDDESSLKKAEEFLADKQCASILQFLSDGRSFIKTNEGVAELVIQYYSAINKIKSIIDEEEDLEFIREEINKYIDELTGQSNKESK